MTRPAVTTDYVIQKLRACDSGNTVAIFNHDVMSRSNASCAASRLKIVSDLPLAGVAWFSPRDAL